MEEKRIPEDVVDPLVILDPVGEIIPLVVVGVGPEQLTVYSFLHPDDGGAVPDEGSIS